MIQQTFTLTVAASQVTIADTVEIPEYDSLLIDDTPVPVTGISVPAHHAYARHPWYHQVTPTVYSGSVNGALTVSAYVTVDPAGGAGPWTATAHYGFDNGDSKPNAIAAEPGNVVMGVSGDLPITFLFYPVAVGLIHT